MTEKKDKRGGARPGAGRPSKPTPRLLRDNFYSTLNQAQEVKDLTDMWQLFKTVAIDKAKQGDTEDMQWIFSRIMPVPKEQDIKVEQDITSNGSTLQNAQIVFGTLPNPGFPDDAQ